MTLNKPLLSILLSLALLATSSPIASACGPFLPDVDFSCTGRPDLPLRRFADGELGILQQKLARSYLFVAYRVLSKTPLTAVEKTSLVSFWEAQLLNDNSSVDLPEKAAKDWLVARTKLANAGAIDEIKLYRSIDMTPEKQYQTYLNCPADAFTNASKRLADRVRAYGKDSQVVKDWLKAQDLVFCHCSTPNYDYGKKVFAPEPAFPQAVRAGADTLTIADRSYQLAAAHFYCQNFDEAKKEFLSIAADKQSPYRPLAPYLAARCDIRKASLQKSPDMGLFAQAKRELLNIANDPASAAVMKQLCLDLVDYVDAQLIPLERLKTLSNNLVTPSNNSMAFSKNLLDFITIQHQILGGDSPIDSSGGNSDIPQSARTDLIDWILCVQIPTDDNRRHALEKWQSTHSNLWLIPCLIFAHGADPGCDQLIKAATAVSPSSPIYLTARYNLIRLLTEQKKIDPARVELNKVLGPTSKMPPSSRCLLMTEKSQVASNFDEYWQDVLQVTAVVTNWGAPAGIEGDVKKLDKSIDYTHGPVCFTVDGADALNNSIPLRLLPTAIKSAHLDKDVKRDFIQAVWARAVMLGELKVAADITPALAASAPKLAASLKTFTQAPTLEEKHFILACLALQNPAMRPYITAGFQRVTAFDKVDDYQDNWWCQGAISVSYGDDGKVKVHKSTKLPFLTDADSAAARSEYEKLCALGPGPEYLLGQVVGWAAKHPHDLRLPDALYRAIRAPKFGFGSKLASTLSKQAFTILHRDFPNDPYTKKSQYWY